jgi:glutamate-1-semialdehyde 2,1-aminomutase
VARAATERDRILLFDHAYHGFDPELVPEGRGVPDAVRKDTIRVPWNDVEALSEAFKRHANNLAAVVMNPLDQSPGRDTVEAAPDFCDSIQKYCREQGTLLVFDDVRAGFRMHPEGSHIPLGLEPDLRCIGKGLGNGYPVSALLGTETLKRAASSLAFTASFIFGAVAFSAAIKVLEIYRRDAVFDRLVRSGERLRDGLLDAAEAAGHAVRYTGPATMPTMLFDGDDMRLKTGKTFALEAARRGVLFHPRLNWFMCAAHDEATIDEALEAAEGAFKATPKTE